MQAKKQNVLLAGLHFLLGAALTIVFIIAIIMDIDAGIFDADALSIILTFAALVGEFFVFAAASFALGAYFLDMDSEKHVHSALRYSVSGWVIMLLYSATYFIYVLAEYQFVFDLLLSVILTLLPLIFVGIVYSKRHAYGNDLNIARVGAVLYFMYIGLFNTIYTLVATGVGPNAMNIISFILSAVMGLTISLSICYYYFKLGNTAQPQQYGPQNNYGYGPQQPYGQQYGQQNGPLQQFRQQQNPYAPQAPVPPVQQAPVQPQAPATKFCPFCGAQMPAGSAFCTNCGGKLQ